MEGSGKAVLVSDGVAWMVLARTGKSDHLDTIVRMLGENSGASG